jgi:predicted metal-dependent hydrolase
MPDDYAKPPGEALADAQRLLDADRPFHAHEVLEAVWKSAPDDERELWRGLAQVAVGLTHVRRGNAKGAQALLQRAADRIEPYEPGPYGLDIAGVVRHIRELADHIATDGINSITDTDLALRLTHSSW